MTERIMTLHPEGKKGVNIEKSKYEAVRQAIIAELDGESDGVTFSELNQRVQARLAGNFDGSPGWYYTTVKLDMEARGEVERIPGKKPQHLRLT